MDILLRHLRYSISLHLEMDAFDNSLQTGHIPTSRHRPSHRSETLSINRSFMVGGTLVWCSFRIFIKVCTFGACLLCSGQSFTYHNCQNRITLPFHFGKSRYFIFLCLCVRFRDCASTEDLLLLTDKAL